MVLQFYCIIFKKLLRNTKTLLTAETGPGKLMTTNLNCNNISLQELNRKQVRRAHELLDQAILDALQGRSDREIEKITITIPKHGSKLGKPKAAVEYS